LASAFQEATVNKDVQCALHGRQGIGLVCIHVAHAVDSREQVGFFWGDDTDTARPDAWCDNCEQALLAVPPNEMTDNWFRSCGFVIFCAKCWDEAKFRLYDQPRSGSQE
jgi:hypothetical protein